MKKLGCYMQVLQEKTKNTKKKQEPCLYLKILNQLIKEKREMNK